MKKNIILDIDKIKAIDEEFVLELRDAGLVHKIEIAKINKSIVMSYSNEYKFFNKEVVFYNDIKILRFDNRETIFLDSRVAEKLVKFFNLSNSKISDKIDRIIYNQNNSIKKEFLYNGDKIKHYE